MIVIGSNTSDNGWSSFTEDVSHFVELRQNRQLALLKRSAKNPATYNTHPSFVLPERDTQVPENVISGQKANHLQPLITTLVVE